MLALHLEKTKIGNRINEQKKLYKLRLIGMLKLKLPLKTLLKERFTFIIKNDKRQVCNQFEFVIIAFNAISRPFELCLHKQSNKWFIAIILL